MTLRGEGQGGRHDSTQLVSRIMSLVTRVGRMVSGWVPVYLSTDHTGYYMSSCITNCTLAPHTGCSTQFKHAPKRWEKQDG